MRSRKNQIIEKEVVPAENLVNNNNFEQIEPNDTANQLKIDKKN